MLAYRVRTLTQCTSVHQMATFGTKTIDNEAALQDTKPPTNGVYTYPVTRIHQDSTDYFFKWRIWQIS